jgi:hypothetical protein
MNFKKKSKKKKSLRRLPVAPPTQRKESSKKSALDRVYDKAVKYGFDPYEHDFDITDLN